MQTVCHKNSNIIDLTELRRRQAPDRRARRPGEESWVPEGASGFCPAVLISTPEERRRARRERHAWCLDVCASLAVILMTAVFALRILM